MNCRSPIVVAAATLLIAGLAAGCSSGAATTVNELGRAPVTTVGESTPTSSSSIDSVPESTVPDLTDIVHTPATGDFVGALKDVSDQKCTRESEGWRVTGTATNPTDGPVLYRIYISLLNSEATTRALVEVEIASVTPDSTGTFDRLIPILDDSLRCVLRVERRQSET